jgi:hypothetical protein
MTACTLDRSSVTAKCLAERGDGVLPALVSDQRNAETFRASVISSVIALAKSENRSKQTGADEEI